MLWSIWFALNTLQAMGRKCAKTHAAQTQVVPCHIFPGSDGSDPGSTKLVSDINFRWFQIHGVNGIQGLKTEQDILTLVVSSGLSYREIARIACTSEGNIKVTVHRARVKLKKTIDAGEV